MIQSPGAVIAVLAGIAALFFFIEQATRWRLFRYFPPLIFIYATPVILRNVGFLPEASGAYDVLRDFGLPVFITLLLIGVNVGAAVRVMGRGVVVMLLGSAGVVVGGAVGYAAVHRWLSPDAWKAFGTLAGSWIGGTGNMAAVAGGLDTAPSELGLAVLADNVIYVFWLPLLLASASFAERFNRWTGVSEERVSRMEVAAQAEAVEEVRPEMRHYLYLGFLALATAWLADWVAPRLPELGPVVSTSTWEILLVTTVGILLSLTPARRIPGSHNLAMAIVYVFVAGMGARASLAGFAQAPAFLLGAAIWIVVHGLFCLAGAWLLKVDVHSAAIASAANVGGAASAPVVAAHHRESLVPVSILMALIGYAVGNYLALLTAQICFWIGTASGVV
jgi:uncharacterized membrane protein